MSRFLPILIRDLCARFIIIVFGAIFLCSCSKNDYDSYADWWIIQELVHNWEPNIPNSCWLHKDKGGKLCMGPVWDFDYSTFVPFDSWRNRKALYYERLFEDPEFVKAVKEHWKKHREFFQTIPSYIRERVEYIKHSESMNQNIWPIHITVAKNNDEEMSFDDAIERMIDSYIAKLNWLNRLIEYMN